MIFRKRDTHIHFVGIGGIGMSGIAEVLVNLGYRVTGTDLADTDTTRRLRQLGAKVHQGHDAAWVGDADVVVTSSAVRGDNPEVVAARAAHIPVIPRAEMLGELMRLKQGVAVAGSHGKTTTTSIIASTLHEAGHDPTSVIGGKVNCFGSNAHLGRGDLMIAEADESDGSFSYLSPTVAIITNIDHEHLDHYGSFAALLDAFVGFANRVPFYGSTILCIDDANVAEIAPRLTKRVHTYGCREDADYRAHDIVHQGVSSRFRVTARGRDLGEFRIQLPGAHNVLNALATIVLCCEQQVDLETAREAMAEFAGVQRRFTLRGEVAGATVIDDYGHHPTEIAATLQAARSAFGNRRIVAVFQPHRYSRVRDHMPAFAQALALANEVIAAPIYPAGERPLDGIDDAHVAASLVEATSADRVRAAPDLATVTDELVEHTRPGDVIIALGAGSVTRVSTEVVTRLQQRQSSAS
ncbi:MAG: UDP-N-acetylmuramate--L-alanine ligase [Myxococcales bacterium FL481]|nr:MAG: UDP-N-acetylmuramate--L-alanine ligase [Myxococcales bacterium FL481]